MESLQKNMFFIVAGLTIFLAVLTILNLMSKNAQFRNSDPVTHFKDEYEFKPTKVTDSNIELNARQNLGSGAVEIFSGRTFSWLAPVHETDSCNQLFMLNNITGEIKKTSISACGGIHFEKTTPFYIHYCGHLIPESTCFDFSTLKSHNLETNTEIELLSTSTLASDETFIWRCFNGNYGLGCQADITSVATGTITIGVYKKQHMSQTVHNRHNYTQPTEFTNQKVREITINLKNNSII